MMFRAEMMRNLTGIFDVNWIFGESRSKGNQSLAHRAGGDRTDKRRVQAAGQQKPDGYVGIKPLLYCIDQTHANAPKHSRHVGNIPPAYHSKISVRNKFPPIEIMSWWKLSHLRTKIMQSFGLGRKDNPP